MERLLLKAKAYQKYIYQGETLFVLGLSLGTSEKRIHRHPTPSVLLK